LFSVSGWPLLWVPRQAQTAGSQPSIVLEAVTGTGHNGTVLIFRLLGASAHYRAPRRHPPRARCPRQHFAGGRSWAVLSGPRYRSVDVQPIQDAAFVGFRTACLRSAVERSPLRIVVSRSAGNIISADAVGRPTKFQVVASRSTKPWPSDEHYFGLRRQVRHLRPQDQAYTLLEYWTLEPRNPSILSIKSIHFSLARRRSQLWSVPRQHRAHLV